MEGYPEIVNILYLTLGAIGYFTLIAVSADYDHKNDLKEKPKKSLVDKFNN